MNGIGMRIWADAQFYNLREKLEQYPLRGISSAAEGRRRRGAAVPSLGRQWPLKFYFLVLILNGLNPAGSGGYGLTKISCWKNFNFSRISRNVSGWDLDPAQLDGWHLLCLFPALPARGSTSRDRGLLIYYFVVWIFYNRSQVTIKWWHSFNIIVMKSFISKRF